MNEKKLYISLVIVGFVLLIVSGAVIFLSAENNKKKSEEIKVSLTSSIYELTEAAYFEGQKDAIEGDIRIKNTAEGWIWTKSPWDDGHNPVYNPSVGFKD